MRAFCPNCGTPNEGMPGGRVTCHACTASFEVPREDLGVSAPPQSAPPPAFAAPPVAPSVTPRPASSIPPELLRPGYAGPPPTGFGAGRAVGGPLNPLAVVSLVLSLLCCLPFSIGAVITGFMANGQIVASNGAQRGQGLAIAGMILGGLSVLINILWLVAAVFRH